MKDITLGKLIGITTGALIGIIIITLFYTFSVTSDFSDLFVNINIIIFLVALWAFSFIFAAFSHPEYEIKNGWLKNYWLRKSFNLFYGSIFGVIVSYVIGFQHLSLYFAIVFAIIQTLLGIFGALTITIIVCCFMGFGYLFYYSSNNLMSSIYGITTANLIRLPLFIIPLFAFFGYVITVKITKKRVLKLKFMEYKKKIENWNQQGYNISKITGIIASFNLSKKIEKLRETENKINALAKIESELNSFPTGVIDHEIDSIKEKLKNPENLELIQEEIQILIKVFYKKVENLITETDHLIQKAELKATRSEDQLWLTGVKFLKQDLYRFKEKHKTVNINYQNIWVQIKNLKDQAVNYQKPPDVKKEDRKESKEHGKDNYAILGVTYNASLEDIKKARNKKMMFHRDRYEQYFDKLEKNYNNGELKDKEFEKKLKYLKIILDEKTAEINKAYEELSKKDLS